MKNFKKELSEYLDEMECEKNHEASGFYKRLRNSKYVCIFGAGGLGKTMAQNFFDNNIKIDFFCDNNKDLCGKEIFNNIKCISINEMKNYKNDLTIVVATSLYKEIFIQLEEEGFSNYYIISEHRAKFDEMLSNVDFEKMKRNLLMVIDILEDEKSKNIFVGLVKNWFKPFYEYPYNYGDMNADGQYFTEDIVKLSDNECFVDVGAFDGDTIRQFLSRTGNKFEKIYGYELDSNNFNRLLENINNMPDDMKNKIVPNNIGLYDENKNIRYGSNLTASVINDKASEVGRIARLSDHLKDEKVTFVKMDIEGSELKALHGAEDIIKLQKPKLAICIYHQASHFWEIPLYIKSIVPEYKIYIRHHTNLEYETVCYAIL